MNRALAEVKEICRGRGEYNVDDVYDDLFDAHHNNPPYSRMQVACILKSSKYSQPLEAKYKKQGRGKVTRLRLIMQYRFEEG